MCGQRLSICLRRVSFPAIETGRRSHVNGITVNKTTQTVESAAAGGAFHIEDVYPLIDGGRFPVKRIVGERVEVWTDIYRDGQDVVAAALIWRHERDHEWRREPLTHHSNDRWFGSFVPDTPGGYVYAIEAWTDEFATWRRGFELKQKTGADLTLDAIEGAGMLTKAQSGGHTEAAVILRQCEDFLPTGELAPLLTDELKDAMAESCENPQGIEVSLRVVAQKSWITEQKPCLCIVIAIPACQRQHTGREPRRFAQEPETHGPIGPKGLNQTHQCQGERDRNGRLFAQCCRGKP